MGGFGFLVPPVRLQTGEYLETRYVVEKYAYRPKVQKAFNSERETCPFLKDGFLSMDMRVTHCVCSEVPSSRKRHLINIQGSLYLWAI